MVEVEGGAATAAKVEWKDEAGMGAEVAEVVANVAGIVAKAAGIAAEVVGVVAETAGITNKEAEIVAEAAGVTREAAGEEKVGGGLEEVAEAEKSSGRATSVGEPTRGVTGAKRRAVAAAGELGKAMRSARWWGGAARAAKDSEEGKNPTGGGKTGKLIEEETAELAGAE